MLALGHDLSYDIYVCMCWQALKQQIVHWLRAGIVPQHISPGTLVDAKESAREITGSEKVPKSSWQSITVDNLSWSPQTFRFARPCIKSNDTTLSRF